MTEKQQWKKLGVVPPVETGSTKKWQLLRRKMIYLFLGITIFTLKSDASITLPVSVNGISTTQTVSSSLKKTSLFEAIHMGDELQARWRSGSGLSIDQSQAPSNTHFQYAFTNTVTTLNIKPGDEFYAPIRPDTPITLKDPESMNLVRIRVKHLRVSSADSALVGQVFAYIVDEHGTLSPSVNLYPVNRLLKKVN